MAGGRTGWRSGMPTTLTLGKPYVGKRCGWFVIVSTSPTAASARRTGPRTSLVTESAAGPFSAWPRVAGKSRTKVSTTLKTATASNTSATMRPTACSVVWLLTCLALTVERLYRVRYLHRGTHPVLAAITLWQLLWLSLSQPIADDTSYRLPFPPACPSPQLGSAGYPPWGALGEAPLKDCPLAADRSNLKLRHLPHFCRSRVPGLLTFRSCCFRHDPLAQEPPFNYAGASGQSALKT